MRKAGEFGLHLSENRVLAWVVLAVCAIGSVIGLGGASLVREQRALMDVFYSGVESQETSRHSMDAYLDRAAECVQVMASEAQLYLGDNCVSANDMLKTLADFGDDDSLDARYSAYTHLQRDSDALYNAMYAADLSDADRVNFKRAYDDFWGCDKYIRKDAYREMASSFNRSLNEFPANLVSKIMGVEEMNSFGA